MRQGRRLDGDGQGQQAGRAVAALSREKHERRQGAERDERVDLPPGGADEDQKRIEEQEDPGPARRRRVGAEVLEDGADQIGEAHVGGDHRELDGEVVRRGGSE